MLDSAIASLQNSRWFEVAHLLCPLCFERVNYPSWCFLVSTGSWLVANWKFIRVCYSHLQSDHNKTDRPSVFKKDQTMDLQFTRLCLRIQTMLFTARFPNEIQVSYYYHLSMKHPRLAQLYPSKEINLYSSVLT